MIRLFSTVVMVDLIRKVDDTKYNIALISQKERTIAVNAMVLGVAFGALAIWLVFVIKGDDSVMIVIAGILLSFGLVQQIVSVGLDTATSNMGRFMSSWNSVINRLTKNWDTLEWRKLRDETEEIFVFPQITYSLPSKIKRDPSVDSITAFIDERRWELAHPQTIFEHDEKSLLGFSKYAIDFLREKLDAYNRLMTIQQRTGTVNPVVFVAVGTLLWLLS
jgi:hypothetical protein